MVQTYARRSSKKFNPSDVSHIVGRRIVFAGNKGPGRGELIAEAPARDVKNVLRKRRRKQEVTLEVH